MKISYIIIVLLMLLSTCTPNWQCHYEIKLVDGTVINVDRGTTSCRVEGGGQDTIAIGCRSTWNGISTAGYAATSMELICE